MQGGHFAHTTEGFYSWGSKLPKVSYNFPSSPWQFLETGCIMQNEKWSTQFFNTRQCPGLILIAKSGGKSLQTGRTKRANIVRERKSKCRTIPLASDQRETRNEQKAEFPRELWQCDALAHRVWGRMKELLSPPAVDCSTQRGILWGSSSCRHWASCQKLLGWLLRESWGSSWRWNL